MKKDGNRFFERSAKDTWRGYKYANKITMLLLNRDGTTREEALATASLLEDLLFCLYKRFEREGRRENLFGGSYYMEKGSIDAKAE